jgi:hypothetical protein
LTLSSPTISDNAVINSNSSSTALRITQTGTGNALVVEDAANPDSTPFVVTADGTTLIGLATPSTTGVGSAKVQIAGGTAPLSFIRQADSSTAINLEFAKARASGAILASGDTIGRLYFSGSDGAAQIPAAYIDAAVDGTPGTNDMPGRLVFSTTADGAATPTERMRIDSSGDVGIGTNSPSATLNVVSNSASDAVRITQTGTGNALVVEDAANPDSTPVVVDASGRVIAGGTASRSYYLPGYPTNYQPGIQGIGGTYTTPAWMSLAQWSTATGNSGGAFLSLNKSNGVEGTQTIVNSGQRVGGIGFAGSDGAKFLGLADIVAEVDGTPGLNDMPGRLVFNTTPNGDDTPTEKMRIDSSGNVGIGTSSPGAKLEVTSNGFLAKFTGSGAQFQGIAIRNNFASASDVGSTFYDAINENGATVGNMVCDILTDGSSQWYWDTQPAGTRTDRRAERLRIGPSGQIGLSGANYGTSGQVLTSQGSGSAPIWSNAGSGMTLLGTLTTTSGNTQTLSGLNLTSYKFLMMAFNGVSTTSTSSSTLSVGGVIVAPALTVAGEGFAGTCVIDLSTGAGSAVIAQISTANDSANSSAKGIRVPITTASTSITVATAGATFDAGTVKIYGVK